LRLEHLGNAKHVYRENSQPFVSLEHGVLPAGRIHCVGAQNLPCCGMPSVMQTARGISASRASSIPAAARGGLEFFCVSRRILCFITS
jgi:hypothetical protein